MYRKPAKNTPIGEYNLFSLHLGISYISQHKSERNYAFLPGKTPEIATHEKTTQGHIVNEMVWIGFGLLALLMLINLTLILRLHQRLQLNSNQDQLASLQMAFSDKLNRLERQWVEDIGLLKAALAKQLEQQQQSLVEQQNNNRLAQQRETAEQQQSVTTALNQYRADLEKNQREALKAQQETLAATLVSMGQQIQQTLTASADTLSKQVAALTQTTDQRLQAISGQVEKRLQAGFEKTTETFARVLEHLSRIDEAQKKITELSGNVVSLQAILNDKRSRGAFGEVQLQALVRNLMPEGSFELQATLSNDKRVDCLLHLPAPSGNVPIDAKFPLESYQKMQAIDLSSANHKQAAGQFRRDIRKHIADIATKYLIPGETADGAVMFIPAEAVFAEIHAHYPELVTEAQQARVWIVSPTTLMAVLTTARAVLKDDATRQQVHVIQAHLQKLSVDFGRFQQRMDKLATHIRQANDDVGLINTSAQKISRRFSQIEAAELEPMAADKKLSQP
jgi:DNA recombination protein RmuC